MPFPVTPNDFVTDTLTTDIFTEGSIISYGFFYLIEGKRGEIIMQPIPSGNRPAAMSARQTIEIIQRQSTFYDHSDGRDFTFDEIWKELENPNASPELKQAIQELKAHQDWQTMLDGDKIDGIISHDNADAFWNANPIAIEKEQSDSFSGLLPGSLSQIFSSTQLPEKPPG